MPNLNFQLPDGTWCTGGVGFLLPDEFHGQANALLRNNGNGAFTDQTDEAGLLVGLAQARDFVFADFMRRELEIRRAEEEGGTAPP